MKSSLITVLTIAGILGTATVAMAVNAETLAGVREGTIGNAIEVLVPVVSDNEPSSPVSSPTPTPPSPIASERATGIVDPVPGIQVPVAPPAPVSPRSGSSSSPVATDDSFHDESSNEDDAEDNESSNEDD